MARTFDYIQASQVLARSGKYTPRYIDTLIADAKANRHARQYLRGLVERWTPTAHLTDLRAERAAERESE